MPFNVRSRSRVRLYDFARGVPDRVFNRRKAHHATNFGEDRSKAKIDLIVRAGHNTAPPKA